jgi:adenosylcobinamide-GDP ribazoletransferase
LAIGGLLVLTDGLARVAGFPGVVRAALVMVAMVVITGGLHLDGLMDSLDGLFGGHSAAQRLEIMRDSRVGSYAVLGACCLLLLKLAALGAMHDQARVRALLLAPVLGRWSIVLAAALFPPARPDGLGAAFRAGLTTRRFALAAGITLAIAILTGGSGLPVFLASCGATWWIGRLIMGRIHGLTGDSYGALVELNETLALLLMTR